MEASHLFSMSLSVASGVDFLVGITAEVGADLVVGAGEVVFAADEGFEDLAGELLVSAAGELRFSGAGDLSVVTETLGSVVGGGDCSGGVISGAAASGVDAGVSVSSWAQAKGAVATTNAVRARMVIFICMFLSGVDYSESPAGGITIGNGLQRGRL